jgi:chitin disaccharide deacetylase
MEKRLIINADDYGLSRGITDGILLTHQEGILTSTSLMVNQPATDYAVSRAEEVPELGIGIHLNLTQGMPVLSKDQVRTLVDDDGYFYSCGRLAKKLLRLQVSAQEIEAEFRAQIQLMKSYGLMPTHADSHHRIHMYPSAARAFHNAIVSEGIRRARAPRKQYWPANGRWGGPHIGPLYRRIAAKSYLEFLQSVVFRDLQLPDAGVTFHPSYSGKLAALPTAWQSTLEHLPGGSYEMWCHPGFLENGFSGTDSIAEQREVEIGILTDRNLRELARRRQIQLISFRQL